MRELFVPWGRTQSLSPCRREVWREVFQIPTKSKPWSRGGNSNGFSREVYPNDEL